MAQSSGRKLWQLTIADIIIIAVFGAISRVVTVIGIMLPLPAPFGDLYFAIQLTLLLGICVAIVRKPLVVIIFVIIQMLVNLLFFGGSPIWALENMIFGIVTELVMLGIWYSTGHYGDKWWSVLIMGTVAAFMDFAATYFVILPYFYDTWYESWFYIATAIPYTLSGTIMALVGWRIGTSIKPLIGK